MSESGERVYVVSRETEGTVYVYGWATHVGSEKYPGGPGLCRKGVNNPRLNLENGGWVYGCESWWGPATEAEITGWIGGRTVVVMDPIHTDEHPEGTAGASLIVVT